MKLKELSPKLWGTIITQNIHSKDGLLLIEKDSILTYNKINLLIKNGIQKVPISYIKIDTQLFLQLERFIIKSRQPLFWEEYIDTLEKTKSFFLILESGEIENPELLLIKIHNLISLLEDKKEFLEFTYSINGYEDSLYRHSINAAILSFLFGKLNILEDPTILSQMGYLHDIGKVKLNQDVLYKTTRLTAEEVMHINNHPRLGKELLEQIGIRKKEILNSAFLHHESRDGNGYPNKLDKALIPFNVQIISVVDIFDTLCSDRVYKERNTFFTSLNKLYFEAAEGKLNPLIVFPWIEYIYNFYLNEEIILSNGLKGKIYYLNPKEIIRPIIELENDTFLDLSQYRDLFIVDYCKNKK